MRFLIEKSILTPDQEDSYEKMSVNKQSKYLSKWLEQHPNRRNLRDGWNVYLNSLQNDGLDDAENPMITFMNEVKDNLPAEVVMLLRNLSKSRKLDVTSEYLKNRSLYEEDTKSVLHKIKALAYSMNSDLQQKASMKITPESLMDSDGDFLNADDMQKVLNQITIKNYNYTIANVVNKLYGNVNLNNSTHVNHIKNEFKNLIKNHKNFNNDMLNAIDKADLDTLINLPIKEVTKEELTNSLINHLSKSSEKTASQSDAAKVADTNVSQQADAKKLIGADVLKQKLGSDLTLDSVKEYVKRILPDPDSNFATIQKQLIDGDSLNDELEDVLSAKISSVMGRDLLDILNKRLIDAVNKATEDSLKGKK